MATTKIVVEYTTNGLIDVIKENKQKFFLYFKLTKTNLFCCGKFSDNKEQKDKKKDSTVE